MSAPTATAPTAPTAPATTRWSATRRTCASGTETEETGRVALRKYVVTEDQTVTVPVSHEEVRLEREPVDGTEAEARPGAMGEAEHEVTLHRERPVVDKTTEAVEKVRLGTRTVTEDEKVSDTVRKERIEVDDPQHALPRDERRS